jgi:hypothetical protein
VVSQKRYLASAERRERNPSRHAIRYVQLPGTDAPITMQSERTGIENKWFALTGRVVELKVEEDGDLHIALHDVTGDNPASLSVKHQRNRSGVRFAQPFLVGLPRGFLFILALRRS